MLSFKLILSVATVETLLDSGLDRLERTVESVSTTRTHVTATARDVVAATRSRVASAASVVASAPVHVTAVAQGVVASAAHTAVATTHDVVASAANAVAATRAHVTSAVAATPARTAAIVHDASQRLVASLPVGVSSVAHQVEHRLSGVVNKGLDVAAGYVDQPSAAEESAQFQSERSACESSTLGAESYLVVRRALRLALLAKSRIQERTAETVTATRERVYEVHFLPAFLT